MYILSIVVLDRNGNEKIAAHHSTKDVDIALPFLAVIATIRPKYFFENDKHCYLKKNDEKIIFFACSEKISTQGQVNLFFTKIKHVKTQKELELLRYHHHIKFFQTTVGLVTHKLPPKNHELTITK